MSAAMLSRHANALLTDSLGPVT